MSPIPSHILAEFRHYRTVIEPELMELWQSLIDSRNPHRPPFVDLPFHVAPFLEEAGRLRRDPDYDADAHREAYAKSMLPEKHAFPHNGPMPENAGNPETRPSTTVVNKGAGRPRKFPHLAHLPKHEYEREVRLARQIAREQAAARGAKPRSIEYGPNLFDTIVLKPEILKDAQWMARYDQFAERNSAMETKIADFVRWLRTEYDTLETVRDALVGDMK